MTAVRRNMRVREIALCRKGANPGARVALFKTDDDDDVGKARTEGGKKKLPAGLKEKGVKVQLQKLIDGLFGKEARTFSEAISAQEARERLDGLFKMMWAFQESLHSIIDDPDAEDKAGLIKTSLDEFKTALEAAATAATTVKEFKMDIPKIDLDKFDEDVRKDVADVLAPLIDAIKIAVERAEKAEAEAKVAKEEAEALKAAHPGANDDGKKKKQINKDEMSEPVREALEASEKRADEAEEKNKTSDERIAKLEDERLTTELTKTAEELAHLPAKTEELVALLKGLDETKREEVVKLLKAAEEQAKQAEIFKEAGRASGEEPGSAMLEAEELAKALRKEDPKLTEHMAKAKVWEQNPDLRKRYDDERQKAH